VSSLGNKLARLPFTVSGGARSAPESNGASARPNAPTLESPTAGASAGTAPFDFVSGSAQGERILADRIHGPGFCQGRVEVGPARLAQASTVAALALDDALGSVDAANMLLVDTETTGLHGGSGTLPFVIGLAWFDGPSLVVRQLFVPRPGQERPLLVRLAERLCAASLLVTFNGKCFDWPLLRARFVMNRLPLPPALPHLDLLHVARRVFKRRLGATRLQDLEAQVLDFHRHGDIAGAHIPAVYFDWLRSGRAHLIERVLVHNAQDLISMAAVLAVLCRRFDTPRDDDAAEDCLGLARVSERSGDPARAEALANAAAERATDPTVELESLALLARLALRRRAFDEAARWLERATAVRAPGVALAHLAYARVCEHALKDFAKALHHALRAAGAEAPDLHTRRIARITAKLGRYAAGA
jgi:uncharacterized protein YprB with RNaseH-like and TPR domain